jgi:hypothetical protein
MEKEKENTTRVEQSYIVLFLHLSCKLQHFIDELLVKYKVTKPQLRAQGA